MARAETIAKIIPEKHTMLSILPGCIAKGHLCLWNHREETQTFTAHAGYVVFLRRGSDFFQRGKTNSGREEVNDLSPDAGPCVGGKKKKKKCGVENRTLMFPNFPLGHCWHL